MFSFRKKPREDHPITVMFSDTSINQRMSVINLLAIISFANGEDQSQAKLKILNSYIGFLIVRGDKCDEYLQRSGIEKMLSDVNALSKNQKEFLVLSAHDIINCSRYPSEKEIITAGQLFEQIGIDENQFVYICDKANAIAKHLGLK